MKFVVGGGYHRGMHNELELQQCASFDYIVSVENLFIAWEKFRIDKRSRTDVLAFERNLEDNLFALRDDLVSGVYRHGAYQPFTVFDPKERRIHKADVRDRVAHQAIVNGIEPLFERRFIFDSFSCRINKGTHAAVRRLRTFLRQASKNNSRTVYVLKCDIKKFFDSVDHAILARLLARRISDERVMKLVLHIIASFAKNPGKGIPLGNLTSQLFANVYLHELDWEVKQMMCQRPYVRYCDDFVIVVGSYQEALWLAKYINAFLRDQLLLELHPNKIHIRTWKQGVDFLGYVLLPCAVVLRPKTVRRMIQNITKENSASYFGLCSHADAYELAQRLWNIIGRPVPKLLRHY